MNISKLQVQQTWKCVGNVIKIMRITKSRTFKNSTSPLCESEIRLCSEAVLPDFKEREKPFHP